MAALRSTDAPQAARLSTRMRTRRPGALAWSIVTAGLLLVTALALLEPKDQTRTRLLGEARLARLWASYLRGDFEAAQAEAQACARFWEPEAERMQATLSRSRPERTVGAYADQGLRRRVLARTALNGAAICYHVAGRAAEALRQSEAALAAYEASMRFPDGRCLDARENALWSPAAASEALRHRLK